MVKALQHPYSENDLERYRLRSRQQRRASLVGGHVMRRKGQSLEFEEYTMYTLGDDVRHIDWRASARYDSDDELVVRKFTAEEQFRLVISLDTRETMGLPAPLTKIQVACWLAEAIAWIALRSNDDVVLHRLFGPEQDSISERLRGSGSVSRIRGALEQVVQTVDMSAKANLDVLVPRLPPATVWIILTDFYYQVEDPSTDPVGGEARRLVERIAAAQDGLRWVILVDLDSWPLEKSLLYAGGTGYWLVDGPGVGLEVRRTQMIDAEDVKPVHARIEGYKRQFLDLARRGGLDVTHWLWPDDVSDKFSQSRINEFFLEAFDNDELLQRLFMRET